MLKLKNYNQIGITDKDTLELFCSCDGLSLQSMFFSLYHTFPSLYSFASDEAHSSYYFDVENFSKNLPELFDDDEPQAVVYTQLNINTEKETSGLNVFFPKHEIFVRLESSVSESYVLYKHGNDEAVEKIIKEILKFYKKPEAAPNNVYAIAYDNCFYLNKLKTKDYSSLNIEKNYNDDFLKEDKKIEEFIKKEYDSGLLILHGEKGTGKSTYIRYLISTNPDKKFVYIPSSMVNILGQPNFSSFLLTLQNHVIILEDCEDAIKDRKANGTPAAVSLLLNLTDGLLSDGLGLKFICTFNDDVKNIDTALLRKGRLVSKYEFELLDADKANVLLNELYREKWENKEFVTEPITDKPLSLANIYHFYDDSYEKERKKII